MKSAKHLAIHLTNIYVNQFFQIQTFILPSCRQCEVMHKKKHEKKKKKKRKEKTTTTTKKKK